MKLTNNKVKSFHITYRNIAGSMRQTWVEAKQHYEAIETFKKAKLNQTLPMDAKRYAAQMEQRLRGMQ